MPTSTQPVRQRRTLNRPSSRLLRLKCCQGDTLPTPSRHCCSSFKMSHTRLNRTVTWMMGLQKETRCDGALVDESQGTDAVGGIFTGEGCADHQGQGGGAAGAELPAD